MLGSYLGKDTSKIITLGRSIMKKYTITFYFISIYISLFILTPVASKACTVQEVLEAHSTLPRSVVSLSEIQGQDLTSNQLCLIETLFEKYALDHSRALNPRRAFEYIVSYSVNDLQAQIIEAVITTARPSNDISETTMIRQVLYGYKYVLHGYSSGFDIPNERSVPYGRATFSFSPEKLALVEFVLERAHDNNYYSETSVIYDILEADQVNQQDIRNVKIALLTAGRDFSDRRTWMRELGYGDIRRSRTFTVRMMMETSNYWVKNLMALVAALEHPNNGVNEGLLMSTIAIGKDRNWWWSEEEYQCSVNALHAYLASGVRGKSQYITRNLGQMILNGNCLGDPYFDRSYFHHYDIETTLDEALVTLEAGREVSIPYQCVGNPCP